MSVRLRASLMRCGSCVSISTDRNSMSLRRMLRASLVEVLLTMDQRRGPKPACPELVRHLDDLLCGSYGISTYVTDDAIFRMYYNYHFCDSNLQPPSITFCYCCCAEECCVISPCWMKKNDVAKMR